MDRRFSYSKIDAALPRNRDEKRIGLMPNGYGADMQSAPSDTAKGEFFNGSLGLLNNATDADANQDSGDVAPKEETQKRNEIVIS